MGVIYTINKILEDKSLWGEFPLSDEQHKQKSLILEIFFQRLIINTEITRIITTPKTIKKIIQSSLLLKFIFKNILIFSIKYIYIKL